MSRHNFTFENFVQEMSQKISKHCHKVDKNEQTVYKINKIINFPGSTFKFQNFAQSQQNFAPLQDDETVTFRNVAKE